MSHGEQCKTRQTFNSPSLSSNGKAEVNVDCVSFYPADSGENDKLGKKEQ